MYSRLHQYLLLENQLVLPGIGTLRRIAQPAKFDVTTNRFFPPTAQLVLDADSHTPSYAIANFLADSLGIEAEEALQRFNHFVHDAQQQLQEEGEWEWPGLGNFRKNYQQPVSLIPSETPVHLDFSIPIQKVAMQPQDTRVKVGEEIHTVEEMTQLLQQEEEKTTDHWWVWAIGLCALAATLMFYHYITFNTSFILPK